MLDRLGGKPLELVRMAVPGPWRSRILFSVVCVMGPVDVALDNVVGNAVDDRNWKVACERSI